MYYMFMHSTGIIGRFLMKLEFSQQIFEESSNIKFHDNSSNGNRVVPCGQTDIAKLIVAFRNFSNALKINKKGE
jgi:hypothetical protein